MFDGNRTAVTTTEEMVMAKEGKYGKADRIWLMDPGMVSQDNTEFMEARGARYLVDIPKSMLRKLGQELITKDGKKRVPE